MYPSATFSRRDRLLSINRFPPHGKAGDALQIFRRALLAVLACAELFVLLAAFAKPAYAYIDPGSGLLAVQVGGSMLAGGLFVLRSKIRKLFRRSTTEPPAPADAKQTTGPNTGD